MKFFGKSRNLIVMLLCAMMLFPVCDAQASTVESGQRRSHHRAKQKQVVATFPQGWGQGWFNMGAAQYCMTSCSGADVNCTINVYRNGLNFYFEASGLKGKNFETRIGDIVVPTKVNQYGEILADVTSQAQVDEIAGVLSAGDVPVVLVVDGKEYRLMPESREAMQSFPQALKWIRTIKDAAEM